MSAPDRVVEFSSMEEARVAAEAAQREREDWQKHRAIELVVGAVGGAICSTIGANPYRILFLARDRFDGLLDDLRETLERENGLRKNDVAPAASWRRFIEEPPAPPHTRSFIVDATNVGDVFLDFEGVYWVMTGFSESLITAEFKRIGAEATARFHVGSPIYHGFGLRRLIPENNG